MKDQFYTKESKAHPGWNHGSLDLQSNAKSLFYIRQFLILPALSIKWLKLSYIPLMKVESASSQKINRLRDLTPHYRTLKGSTICFHISKISDMYVVVLFYQNTKT